MVSWSQAKKEVINNSESTEKLAPGLYESVMPEPHPAQNKK